MQLAGQAGGTSIQSDGRHLVAESIRNTTAGIHNSESTLSISDFQETDFGYYWCMISSREQGQPFLLPNPSHIVLISEPCNPTARQCESLLLLYNTTQGVDCADEAMTTVIPPSSPECTQPPTTSVALVPSPTYTYTIQPTVTSIVPSIVQVMVAQTNESSSTELFYTPLGVSHTPHPSTRIGVDSVQTASLATTSVATQSKLEPSPTEVVLASEAQDKGGIADQIVWLLIGVAVAILLAAIMIVLTAIVCIQCKRRKIKGE